MKHKQDLRYICENIRLILLTIDITYESNLPGMIFFSDFEKAFDSFNHRYMFKCLRPFNFKNDLVIWVKLLYKNAKGCETNNGHHSDFSTYGVVWDRAAPCPHTYLLFALNYYQTKS